jgi:hypothetical protein
MRRRTVDLALQRRPMPAMPRLATGSRSA